MKEQTDAIAVAVQEVLDAALARHHERFADETFVECLVCNEWDGHQDGCFVPMLEQWLNKGEDDNKGGKP